MASESLVIADEIKAYLNEIAERLWTGHATVMIGAGFSRNAKIKYNSKKDFPDWNQLGDAFYEKIHGKKPDEKKRYLNAIKLADEVQAAFGRPALNEILRSKIPDEEYEPSKLHTKVLELPWTDVFTTNYDTLLERACINVTSQRFDIVINKEDLVYSQKPRIIKLHGSFPSQRPFVITEEDYRKYPDDYAPFVNTVQQSLLENSLCLIGFSGEDPNFLQWIGWIRDNLGKDNSPKIFLIGIFDLLDAQKKLLEQRNIVLIDMSICSDIHKDDHAKALGRFFGYLFSKKADNKLEWPFKQQFWHPNLNDKNEQKLITVIEAWKKLRKSYPNWEILPEDRRNSLWNYTSDWLVDIKSYCDKLKTPHDIEFLYEINWRLEKCLYPIYNNNISAYELIIEKYNPLPSSGATVERGDEAHRNLKSKEIEEKCIELQLSMMRFYREEGFLEKWEISNKRIIRLYSTLSHECIARLHYERCLYTLFTLKISDIREQIISWPVNESLPFWEAKRAGLLAELGDIKEAERILENSLNNIRMQRNLSPVLNDYSSVSSEALVMLLLDYVKDSHLFSRNGVNITYSDDDIKEVYFNEFKRELEQEDLGILEKNSLEITKVTKHEGFDASWSNLQINRSKEGYKEKWNSLVTKKRSEEREDIREQFRKRWNILKQYKCDPCLDVRLFRNLLEREPSSFADKTQKHEFDIGRVTTTNHIRNADLEAFTAYSFLRYCEETGIPFRIPGLNIMNKSAEGALKRIGKYSPYWSLITFLRAGNSKTADMIFSRESIYKKSVEQIDRLIEEYLQVLKNCQTEIEQSSQKNTKNFSIVLASVIPEVLSRLCVKCSIGVKDKLLEFLKETYESGHRHKYKEISSLTKRLLRSYSNTENYLNLPKLLEFPVLKNLNIITSRDYPELFGFVRIDKEHLPTSKDIAIEQSVISQLLQKVGSSDSDERKRAICRMYEIYKLNLLTAEQVNDFSEAIWSQIDKITGFPKDADFYKFAFIKSFPCPSNIDPVSLFKEYVVKENFPIQKNKAEKGITMTGGDIALCDELIGVTTSKSIDWSEQEAIDIFQRLLEWWDLDKEFIVKDKDKHSFVDISVEFRRRFSRLTEILTHVILPRLTPQTSIKEDLSRLLKELYKYGIPCVAVNAASIHVFPDQSENVFERIELTILSKEQEEIVDGYNAIYQIFVLHHSNKIAKIPNGIFAHIVSPIKSRHSLNLNNAMRIGIDILNDFPETIFEESLYDILLGLDFLVVETNLQSQRTSEDIAECLEVRSTAMSLAYALHNYYLKKDLPIPETVQKWKLISDDIEEFSDIRNKWETDKC